MKKFQGISNLTTSADPYGRLSSWKISKLEKNWGPFLERPDNFSGPKVNFEIKTSWIVTKFLAHKPVNSASFLTISLYYFQNYWKFDLECKHGKHKTAFGPEKLSGLSRNRPLFPCMFTLSSYYQTLQLAYENISISYNWKDNITVAHKCNGETKSHGKTNFNSRHNKINLQSNETSRQNKINSRQNNINSRQNKISSRQNTINSRQNKISSRQNTINSRQNKNKLTAKYTLTHGKT